MGERVRLAVVGGVNVDVLALVDRLPDGADGVLAERYHEGPGGKGANQAVAAAATGADVHLVAAVGDDAAGRSLLDGLEARGVRCEAVALVPGVPTGRVVGFVTPAGDGSTAYLPGANHHLAAAAVADAADLLAAADVVVAQLEVPLEAVRAAVSIGRRGGTQVVLDASPPSREVATLLPQVDLVRCNATEAAELTGVQVAGEAGARRAARRLLRLGAGGASVSAGAAGDLLVVGDASAWCDPPSVPVVDTTGAGDALLAAVAVRLAEGGGLDEAAAFGSAAAALVMGELGAQPASLTRGRVAELAERIAVTSESATGAAR